MRLYLNFLVLHLKRQMQYKTSFFLTLFGQFGVAFTVFLGVYFMMDRFQAVDGFTMPQVLLCFALVLSAFSLAETFGRGFDLFPGMIRRGEFDGILLRPRNEIFLVLVSQFDLTRIGRLLQAAVVLVYALPRSGVHWAADKYFTVFLMVFCGSILFFSLFLLCAGISFFTIDSIEFMNIFTDGGREFGRYPFSVYGEKVLKFLTYVVPLALFQYYPLLYLTGRKTDIFHMLSPLAGMVFFLPCLLFWKYGVRKYQSTGS